MNRKKIKIFLATILLASTSFFLFSSVRANIYNPLPLTLTLPDCSRTVITGDSITARNGLVEPWADNAGASSNINESWDGYFSMLNSLAGMPCKVIRNSGVSSETSTQIANRFPNDVIPYRPSLVSIMAGTNDIGTIATSTTIANIRSMADQARAVNAFVVLWTIPPKNGTGGNPLTLPARSQRSIINQSIRDYAKGKSNVLVCDTEKYTSDNLSTTGTAGYGGWKSGFASDGTHPSSLSAIYNMALPCVEAFKKIFPPMELLKSASDTYDGAGSPATSTRSVGQNILSRAISMSDGTGGTATGNGGTIVGTPPSGTVFQVNSGSPQVILTSASTSEPFTLPNGSVYYASSTSMKGLKIEVAATTTAAVAVEYFYQASTPQYTWGRYYEFSGKIEILNNAGGIQNVQVALRDAGGVTSNYVRALDSTANVGNTTFPATTTITFRTPRFKMRLPGAGAPETMRASISFGLPAPAVAPATTTIMVSNLAIREFLCPGTTPDTCQE